VAERASRRAWRETRPTRGPPDAPVYFDPAPGLTRLDQNTNPRTPPVVGRAGEIAAKVSLNRYGTSRGSRLRSALSQRFGIPASNLIVGNGSDELLHTAARAFLGPGRVAALWRPGYDPYAVFSLWTGATVRELPLDPFVPMRSSGTGSPWAAPAGFLRGVSLLFHSSPHNPTGGSVGGPELDAWSGALGKKGLLLLDEAYAEYAFPDPSGAGPLWEAGLAAGNVLFTRTFSKAWGLAGLRVGWGVASAPLVERLEAYSVPFTLDSVAEELAIAALEDDRFVRESTELVRRERPRLAKGLEERGFRVHPSVANFLLTDPPMEGGALWEALRARSVLVRRVRTSPADRMLLRVSVGLPEEHERLFAALDEVLPSAAPSSSGRAALARRGR
jgi:histidinol-phosphate aminotransferase